MITLKEICAELKIDPRIARKCLRAEPAITEGREPGAPWHWEKGSAREKEARKILDARSK